MPQPPPQPGVRGLLRGAPYRRLLAVRLTTQLGDGGFEVALASLFFFSPERATTAGGIALAFAVLTLPFTLVGPWAGVPLDRWSRRNTLVLGNLVRAALVLVVAALVATGQQGLPLYAVVLLCVSVNRFLLAALSAGLPHVVAPRCAGHRQRRHPDARHGGRPGRQRGGLRRAPRWASPTPPSCSWSPRRWSRPPLLGLRLGVRELGPDRLLLDGSAARAQPSAPFGTRPVTWRRRCGTCASGVRRRPRSR